MRVGWEAAAKWPASRLQDSFEALLLVFALKCKLVKINNLHNILVAN